METIFAQSSAKGRSGVTVFRLSGPNALKVAQEITSKAEFKERYAHFCRLIDNKLEVIDEALVIYFKAPHSFTGEDVVEIHTHGSIAVAKALTDLILSRSDVRHAEAGEFAKRAFLNGKMDLTKSEGLNDLIEAETIMQHKQAMRQFSGELEKLYESWRKKILKTMAFLEAYIDFPDEDLPDSVVSSLEEEMRDLKSTLKEHLADNRRGERLRNGLHLCVFGPPNAGKSSLMNFLCQREVAIVTDIAGTTRDIIETHLDIGGYPVILKDTAGLRSTDDKIEFIGIQKAKDSLKDADIKILMLDASAKDFSIEDVKEYIDDNTIIVLNKVDLNVANKYEALNPIEVSIKQNKGLDLLTKRITEIAESLAGLSASPGITRLRHRIAVQKALLALENFKLSDTDIVLAAEDLRIAANALSMLTGRIDVEEVLGEIFSNFCIGK